MPDLRIAGGGMVGSRTFLAPGCLGPWMPRDVSCGIFFITHGIVEMRKPFRNGREVIESVTAVRLILRVNPLPSIPCSSPISPLSPLCNFIPFELMTLRRRTRLNDLSAVVSNCAPVLPVKVLRFVWSF